jgi:hypothetical protein
MNLTLPITYLSRCERVKVTVRAKSQRRQREIRSHVHHHSIAGGHLTGRRICTELNTELNTTRGHGIGRRTCDLAPGLDTWLLGVFGERMRARVRCQTAQVQRCSWTYE